MNGHFIRNIILTTAMISSISTISFPWFSKDENTQQAFNSNYMEIDKPIKDYTNKLKSNSEDFISHRNIAGNICETENSSESPSKIDISGLCNDKISWWFKPNKAHTTPEINLKLNFNLIDYDAHYVGDTSRQVLYLTFDEGYENGYTAKILDILKENEVKAMFFVTSPYLKSNPDLIKRMVDEGHIVGNHTNHHPSMPTVCGSEEKFLSEFTDVENKYKEITGEDMPKFFRPPMGEYSQKSLAMTKNLGYKTVFWSFAYMDWDINKQPDPVKAKETILNGLHNGSIMLIHAVSKTNTEILDSILKEAKTQGYEFELLP